MGACPVVLPYRIIAYTGAPELSPTLDLLPLAYRAFQRLSTGLEAGKIVVIACCESESKNETRGESVWLVSITAAGDSGDRAVAAGSGCDLRIPKTANWTIPIAKAT